MEQLIREFLEGTNMMGLNDPLLAKNPLGAIRVPRVTKNWRNEQGDRALSHMEQMAAEGTCYCSSWARIFTCFGVSAA